jgi:hypothetical protein
MVKKPTASEDTSKKAGTKTSKTTKGSTATKGGKTAAAAPPKAGKKK